MRRAAPADAKQIAGGTATHIATVSSARVAISKDRLSRISLALGSRAGAPVRGPRPTTLDGLDLRANVWVPRWDRARLERLCRYVLRPPVHRNGFCAGPTGACSLRQGGPPTHGALMLPSTEAVVKPPITPKRSVTESEGVASKPVLPTPPERGPRDGARTSRVCRGNA